MPRLRSVVAVLALGLSACIPARIQMMVNGLGESRPAASFVVLPLQQGVSAEDLQFLEAKRYLVRAMEEQGYHLAPSIDSADVALFLAYGIGEPHTSTYAYSVPVYGKPPSSTTTVSAKTTGRYGTTVRTEATATTESEYGVVGVGTATRSVTNFTRYVLVSAVDLPAYKAGQQIKEDWRTTVVSTGSSGDLRRVLPAMFAAAAPYLGKNTGRAVSVTLRESDSRIVAIRGTP